MTTERERIELRRAVLRARLKGAFAELREASLAPLDVRPIVRRRPWSSVGAAIVVGFLSGLGLDRALRGRGSRERAKSDAAASNSRREERHLFARVQDHAFRVMKRVATMAIVATLRERPSADADADGEGTIPGNELGASADRHRHGAALDESTIGVGS